MFRKAILPAFCLLASTPALATDVSGTWMIAGPVTPARNLVQTGNSITGSCKGANAQGPVTGTVDGASVKWTYSWITFADQSPGSFDFSGTQDGDTITGTLSAAGNSAPFTATRLASGSPSQAQAPIAQLNRAPPKTVWDSDADGNAIHLQSGLICPRLSGAFQRTGVAMFDQTGFDVSCNYRSAAGSDITVYLTRRDPALLQQTYQGAIAAVIKVNPGAARRTDTLPAPAGQTWLQAGFTEQAGAVHSDLLLASLSGWEFEFRATYKPDDVASVTAAIADLNLKVVSSAGARLADCAASPAPERTGQRIRNLDSHGPQHQRRQRSQACGGGSGPSGARKPA